MKKITLLTLLCTLLAVPITFGQTATLSTTPSNASKSASNVSKSANHVSNSLINNTTRNVIVNRTAETTPISKDYSRGGRSHCNPDYTTDITGSLPPGGAPMIYSGDCTGVAGCNDYFDLDLLTEATSGTFMVEARSVTSPALTFPQ